MDKSAIVQQCKQEYLNAMQFKQGRVSVWKNIEDLYFGRVKLSTKGRFNIPFPIMSGFIDTLLSKMDDPPRLKFTPAEDADTLISKKVQSAYDNESRSVDADFEQKDLDGKKLAAFYGRAIFRVFSESDPKYKFNLFVTDPYDFFCDPMGGADLEDHRFLGEDNIFKDKYQLIDGANSGLYDKESVNLLVNDLIEGANIQNDNYLQNKANRFSALGLNNQSFNYSGDNLYKFIEQGTTYKGVRYKVLYNFETGIAVSVKPLKEVFKSGLWWFVSWATHRDKFNFWSKSAAEDVVPLAEAIKILANQELDNRQKTNWGMRMYDPAVIANPAELNYRPDGLVATKSGVTQFTPLANAVYEFKTGSLNGTINLVEWLDTMIGKKSGVTADTQGVSAETKVGIYYGNMQQVADRFGLLNRYYSKCHAAIGRRYLWGLVEHCPSKMMVKLVGEKGVEWGYLTRREINPEMNIIVESGSAEMQVSQLKSQKRIETLKAVEANPAIAAIMNPRWIAEEMLRSAEYSEEEIKRALDTSSEASSDILAKASMAIQEIIAGKEPKLVRSATTGFQQKILDFALDNTDDDQELFMKLTNYAKAHDQIVMENMMRKAITVRSQKGMPMMTEVPNIPPGSMGMDMEGGPKPQMGPTPTMPKAEMPM